MQHISQIIKDNYIFTRSELLTIKQALFALSQTETSQQLGMSKEFYTLVDKVKHLIN